MSAYSQDRFCLLVSDVLRHKTVDATYLGNKLVRSILWKRLMKAISISLYPGQVLPTCE